MLESVISQKPLDRGFFLCNNMIVKKLTMSKGVIMNTKTVSYKKDDIDAMIADLKYIEGFLVAKLQKDQADIVARIAADLETKGAS